ncbi:MAG: hypothetical protein GC185_06770 [Alphaproteobacteria bacterium]|nr:hypothetical protein [Alphaproteobacteria bacterium]
MQHSRNEKVNPYRVPSRSASLQYGDFEKSASPKEIVDDILFYPLGEDVNLIFMRKVRPLSIEDKRRIADMLEARFVSMFDQFSNTDKNEALVSRSEDADREMLNDFQKLSAIMHIIVEIKGGSAHPFVKRYMDGVSVMSDERFNSCAAHEELLKSIIEKKQGFSKRPPNTPRP